MRYEVMKIIPKGNSSADERDQLEEINFWGERGWKFVQFILRDGRYVAYMQKETPD